ncbi:choline-sulfatase [Variovorax paradoxus]|uniref:choline-sulfatase n=1 Tax=Variovorax paradoxus TaxID=34073 RepID=UPI0009C0A8F2|nr:choline-sulfatase [Variovorax paradoxus]
MERPNILFVMCDQMSALALSLYGHKVTKTPHLAALAEQGVLFENAYTTFPLCTPARVSLATGELPSTIGGYDNGAELPASVPTFAHYARLLGYQTSVSGKLHYIGPDQLHGFEERLTTDIYPASFEWTANWDKDAPRYDFDAHGGVSTTETVADAGPCARSLQLDYDEEVLERAVRKIFDLKRSSDKRPFLLKVSFTHPHDPYVITKEFWDQYSDEEIDLPSTPELPLDRWDQHSQYLFAHFRMAETQISPQQVKNARRGYYGAISYVDRNLGILMQALQDAGYDKNTVVIFTADHGDMMGEHGLWFKKTFYDWAMRVPLLIHAPSRFAPARVKSNVSLVDLLPTIVDLAGGSPGLLTEGLPGRSLVPALEGGAIEGPDVIYAEHTDGGTPKPRVMVRMGKWKYIISRAFPTQLFNLEDDPLELRNLADIPEVSTLQAQLQEICDSRWNLDQLEKDVRASQQRHRLVHAALNKGRFQTWEYQPGADAHARYVRRGDSFPTVEQAGYVRYPESAD